MYTIFSISHCKPFHNNKKRFPKWRNQTWWRNSVQKIHKLNKKQVRLNFSLAYLVHKTRMEQGKAKLYVPKYLEIYLWNKN